MHHATEYTIYKKLTFSRHWDDWSYFNNYIQYVCTRARELSRVHEPTGVLPKKKGLKHNYINYSNKTFGL